MAIKFLNTVAVDTDVLYVDASSNEVGIGTDSPDRKLHVKDVNIVVSKFEGTNTGSLMDLVNSSSGQLYNGIRFTQGATGKMAITHIADGTTKGYIQIGNSWATGSEILVVDGRTSNVGIGTTSPTNKLDIRQSTSGGSDVLGTGAITIGSDNPYWTIRGTATSLQDLAFDRRYAGAWVESMRIERSTGNVGIGTDNPSVTLHVNGWTRVNGGLQLDGSNRQVMAIDNTSLLLGTNNTEKMRIDASGNVGIGTTGPDAKLHVNAGTSNTVALFESTDATSKIFIKDNSTSNDYSVGIGAEGNDLTFHAASGGTERMRIISTGNVGIGTTSPGAKLDVQGTILVNNEIQFVDANMRIFRSSNDMRIRTGGSDKVTILSGGNVGIGTTSPTQKLHVVGNARVTGAYYDSNNSPGTANQVLVSTATGTDWVDGSGSSIIGGPYLPLAGNTTATAITGDVYLANTRQVRFLTSGNLVGLRLQASGTSSFIDNEVGDMYFRQEADGNNMFFQADDGSGGNTTYFSVRPNNGARTQFEKNTRHNDGIKAFFGTDEDLQIYHDSTNSYSAVVDVGTGYLLLGTDGPFVLIGNSTATETYIKANNNSSVELYYDNSKKFETTSVGVSVTSTLDVQSFIYVGGNDSVFAENNLRFKSAGAAFIDHNTVSQSIKFRLSNSSSLDVIPLEITPSYLSSTVDMYFGDNDKIRLGASSDLQIYHDSSDNNSYIKEVGAGSLQIWAKDFEVYNADGTETLINADVNAGVQLYFDNSTKIATTSAGVTVTGGISLSGNISASTGDLALLSSSGEYILYGATNAQTMLYHNGLKKFETTSTGVEITGKGTSSATITSDGSSTLTTKGYVDGLITGATIYRGAWDPSGGGYGSPDLSTVTQTSGYYYICSAAGTAEPNGTGTEPDTWETGDWVIYNDVSGTGQWQKIDNSSVLSGVGTGQTVALWEGAGSVTDSETLGNAPITVSGNNTTFAGTIESGDIFIDNGAVPKLKITDSGNGGGGGASGKIIYANTAGNTIGLGYTSDLTTDSDFIISTDASSAYGGYLGLDAAAILDPSDIILDPKTNVYITKSLGIGTSSPNDALEVAGNSATTHRIRINNANASGTETLAFVQDTTFKSWVEYNNSTGNFDVWQYTNNPLRFATNNTERMRIDNVGAVLIGGQPKIDTATKLQVGNSDSGVTSIWSNADDIVFEHNTNLGLTFATPNNAAATIAFADPQSVQAGWIQYLHDVDAMRFGTNGNNERMRIDSSGNVGIGTTNPQQKLQIGEITTGGSTATPDSITLGRTFSDTPSQNLKLRVYDDGTSIAGIGVSSGQLEYCVWGNDAEHVFFAGTNQIMTIKGGGNVGIGVTNPSEKLVVDGKVIINNTNVPNNLAQLNIGSTGGGETRAIDIDGSWSAGESKSITFTHGSASTEMVGQINCVYNSPSSSIRWGKLYHSGDSSTYTMELESTSLTTANLTVAGSIQMADDTATASATKVGTMRYRTGTEYVDVDGTNLISNPDFTSDTAWTKETGWTISGGELVATAAAGNTACYQTPGLTNGSIYRCTFTISEYTSGKVSFRAGTSAANTFFNAVGTYSVIMTAGGTLQGRFGLESGVTTTLKISQCSIVEVVAEDASYADMCMQTGASTYEWVNIVRNTY